MSISDKDYSDLLLVHINLVIKALLDIYPNANRLSLSELAIALIDFSFIDESDK